MYALPLNIKYTQLHTLSKFESDICILDVGCRNCGHISVLSSSPIAECPPWYCWCVVVVNGGPMAEDGLTGGAASTLLAWNSCLISTDFSCSRLVMDVLFLPTSSVRSWVERHE